jgi:hypothetical protein
MQASRTVGNIDSMFEVRISSSTRRDGTRHFMCLFCLLNCDNAMRLANRIQLFAACHLLQNQIFERCYGAR